MSADTSAMRETMATQPAELARILADTAPVEAAADRIRGAKRILLAGTGTSFHTANHGAYLLRAAGREAWAIEAFAATLGGPAPGHGRRADPALAPQQQALHDAGRATRPAATRSAPS